MMSDVPTMALPPHSCMRVKYWIACYMRIASLSLILFVLVLGSLCVGRSMYDIM